MLMHILYIQFCFYVYFNVGKNSESESGFKRFSPWHFYTVWIRLMFNVIVFIIFRSQTYLYIKYIVIGKLHCK